MEGAAMASPYFPPTTVKTEPPDGFAGIATCEGGNGMPKPAKGKRKIKKEPVMEEFGDCAGGNVASQPAAAKTTKKKIKQEKITDSMPVQKKKRDRFKGMSEEEVLLRKLPDHLDNNLDIVIVGINPGLTAAYIGHHYAGPGNHFWKCLFLAGLIPEPMNAFDDSKLLNYGIGFTNIVARTTRGSADLSKKEIKEGGEILAEKLRQYKPKIAAFNGKGIYEVFCGHKNFHIGKQPEPLPGTDTLVFVMPSSSARFTQLPRAIDKVPFYLALKKLRDHLLGQIPDLDEADVCFPDLELKVKPRADRELNEVKTEPGTKAPRKRGPRGKKVGPHPEMPPGFNTLVPMVKREPIMDQNHCYPDLGPYGPNSNVVPNMPNQFGMSIDSMFADPNMQLVKQEDANQLANYGIMAGGIPQSHGGIPQSQGQNNMAGQQMPFAAGMAPPYNSPQNSMDPFNRMNNMSPPFNPMTSQSMSIPHSQSMQMAMPNMNNYLMSASGYTNSMQSAAVDSVASNNGFGNYNQHMNMPSQGPPPNMGSPGTQQSMGSPGSHPGLASQGHPNMGSPGASHPNMGSPGSHPNMGSQGHPNMGSPGSQPNMGSPGHPMGSQGHPNMGSPGPGHPNMGSQGHPNVGSPGQGHPPNMVSQGHSNMGSPGQGHPSMGSQGHPSTGSPGQGHPNMGSPGQGHPNMASHGHPNMGSPGQGHPNMASSGQGHPSMGSPGQSHPNMGSPSQAPPNMGSPGRAHPQQISPQQGNYEFPMHQASYQQPPQGHPAPMQAAQQMWGGSPGSYNNPNNPQSWPVSQEQQNQMGSQNALPCYSSVGPTSMQSVRVKQERSEAGYGQCPYTQYPQ